MEIGKGPLRRAVVRAVYYREGTIDRIVEGPESSGLEEHAFDEWHYRLLDAEGYVLGHGDHYFDVEWGGESPGDHVRAALDAVIGDEEIPIAEVTSTADQGVVHPFDLAQGKVSRSGSPHCTSCGHKVRPANFTPAGGRAARQHEGSCPNCGEDLAQLNPPASLAAELGVISTPTLMLAVLQLMAAWLGVLLATFSNYWEDKVGDAYGNHSAADVTQSYTKLHTGDPGEDGTNNAAGETTRKSTSFGASSGGVITTDADLDWTSVASTETLSHVSQWDASSAGNCLGSGALTASRSVTAGDNFKIASGSLTVTTT